MPPEGKHGLMTRLSIALAVVAVLLTLVAIVASITVDVAKKDYEDTSEAIDKGDASAVRSFLLRVADVNATVLHNAAQYRHTEIAKLLIDKGADVNAKDMSGDTPLDLADINNHQDIATLLRVHGAK